MMMMYDDNTRKTFFIFRFKSAHDYDTKTKKTKKDGMKKNKKVVSSHPFIEI